MQIYRHIYVVWCIVSIVSIVYLYNAICYWLLVSASDLIAAAGCYDYCHIYYNFFILTIAAL